MLEFIRNEFIHAAPVLAAAAFAIMIVIERTWALFMVYPFKNEASFFSSIRDLVLSHRVNDAVALCDRYKKKPVANVVREALLRSHQPLTSIEDGIEVAILEESDRLNKRTAYLSSIANVATLMGLFGTIGGLIYSFSALGNLSAQEKGAALASGISTALNATMLGIGVAIPCMVAYSILINQTNKIGSSLDKAGFRSLDILKQRFYQVGAGGQQAAPGATQTGVNPQGNQKVA